MRNFEVTKTVTATLTYMDLVRIANALELKSQDETQSLGGPMMGTTELAQAIQEMLDACVK